MIVLLLLTVIELIPTIWRMHWGHSNLFHRATGSAPARLAGRPPTLSSLLLSGRMPRKVGRIHRMWPPTANPMLSSRFLVEVLGSVKKFHILVEDNSDRELRDRREDAGEVTDCPGEQDKHNQVLYREISTWRQEACWDVLEISNLSIPDKRMNDNPH